VGVMVKEGNNIEPIINFAFHVKYIN